ncbi:hypothetical protein E2C01_050445 [Portunus trituberculatus]|uniref:Uncharacterized protein n=1 Tax=Portunus trituberculatus TaxID=210409 RepID=A0A5B7GFZ7_PORTR|nr:hypothetical protein [Portunus trituberculatus]
MFHRMRPASAPRCHFVLFPHINVDTDLVIVYRWWPCSSDGRRRAQCRQILIRGSNNGGIRRGGEEHRHPRGSARSAEAKRGGVLSTCQAASTTCLPAAPRAPRCPPGASHRTAASEGVKQVRTPPWMLVPGAMDKYLGREGR